MADSARDLLITGLRNAHAMGTQAHELMERQSERHADYPEVRSRLKMHLQETEQQIARLEACLKRCGESQSPLKDTVLGIGANLAAMAHSLAGDKILKNTFANNAFEHYEIAAYKSLLALCKQAGVDLSGPLQQSLREEEQMAQWVDSHVEDITLQYLAKMEHGGVRRERPRLY